MLRSNKASDIANAFVDDGDDIHITSSFRASEENSSVVGNASCFGSSRSFMPTLPMNVKVDDCDDNSTVSADSTVAMDDQEGRDCEQATSKKGRFSVKILRRPLNLTKKLHRSSEKLLPWSVNTFLTRPRQSRATREYQEMLEHDMPLSPAESDVASYAETVESIRSSRINVATGRSLLVRQKAQVVGRRSAAEAEWDIGSALSSDSSSASSSSSTRSSRNLGLQRSLSWDNASTGGRSDISQLTGDSFRSKRSQMMASRQMMATRAMYLDSHHSLLGTTEEEEECENEITKDDNMAPNRAIANSVVGASQKEGVLQDTVATIQGAARKVVNRLIWETKHIIQEFDDRYAFTAIAVNGKAADTPSHANYQCRGRGFSDSDFVFEMQRHRASLDESVVDEQDFQVPSPRETFSSDACRSRAYSDSILSNHPAAPDNVEQQPPTRPRCASDVYVPRREIDSGLDMATMDDFDSDNSDSSDMKAPGDLQNIMKSPMVDPQQLKRLFGPPSSAQYRKGSQDVPESIPLLSDHKVRKSHRRLSSNPEFTTSGDIWTTGTPSPSMIENHGIRGAPIRVKEVDPRGVLQPVQRGLTTPNAASAAKVLASALRPTNSAGVPPKTMPNIQNYYWNDNSDDESFEEVLWALSKDDSFENLF